MSSRSSVCSMLNAALRLSRSMDDVTGIAAWSVSGGAGEHAIEAAELTSLEVEQHQVVDRLRRGAAGRLVGS